MTVEHRRDSHGRHFARLHLPGGISTTPKREEAWTDAEAIEWREGFVGTEIGPVVVDRSDKATMTGVDPAWLSPTRCEPRVVLGPGGA